jgi:hypothetical protein
MKPFACLSYAFGATAARKLGERAQVSEDRGVSTFVLPDNLVPHHAPVPYLATVAAPVADNRPNPEAPRQGRPDGRILSG